MSNKVVICGVDTSTLPKLSEEQSKQYLIEIPHNAYQISEDEGCKVQVLEVLDYGKVKFAKCLYKDHHYESNIYIQIEDENIGSELCVKYDISKIHITEKAMDIKIY